MFLRELKEGEKYVLRDSITGDVFDLSSDTPVMALEEGLKMSNFSVCIEERNNDHFGEESKRNLFFANM